MVELAVLNTDAKPTWCPGCVLPGTLIHKNPSVDKIENIKVGDRVLGSDGDYHKVTEVLVHRHQGKMYKIISKCFGATVLTEEHPVLAVKREDSKLHNKVFDLNWTRADSLRRGDYLAYPILKSVKDLEEIELPLVKKDMDRKSKSLPTRVKITEGFMRLCGYYLAEGHVHTREITFTFNVNETGFVDDVVRIVKDTFGLDVSIKSRAKKNILEVTINSSQLARLFVDWFGTGAEKKRIPHFMMLLSKEKQIDLIKGMWRGDGWVGKRRANYKTISKVLAEQLKILLVRQLIVPIISVNRSYGMHKKSYSIQVVSYRDMQRLLTILDLPAISQRPGKPPSSIILEDFVLIPIREIETFDYKGDVYNFEVEDVNSYVSENATLHNCGDYGILNGLKRAIVELGIEPHQMIISSGIGCAAGLPHWVHTYGFHGLHGRSVPIATGIKLANPELTVFADGGDGDGYGIGVGHLIHLMRRNLDITYIVHNNQVYGLTTGQLSPTSELGMKTKSSPFGSIEEPVNPIALALGGGASFVARGFSGNLDQLVALIVAATKHKGFALVDVLQPCVTFNHQNTYEFFMKRVYDLQKEGHDPSDIHKAFEKAQEWGDRIPTGIIYQKERPTYEEQLTHLEGVPIVKHDISNVDITRLFEEFV